MEDVLALAWTEPDPELSDTYDDAPISLLSMAYCQDAFFG